MDRDLSHRWMRSVQRHDEHPVDRDGEAAEGAGRGVRVSPVPEKANHDARRTPADPDAELIATAEVHRSGELDPSGAPLRRHAYLAAQVRPLRL
jgi:hypothetical protein